MLRHTCQAVAGHVLHHVRSEDPDPVPDPCIDILGDRVVGWGNEIPYSRRSHLVLLHGYLWEPNGVECSGDGPGVILREGNNLAPGTPPANTVRFFQDGM